MRVRSNREWRGVALLLSLAIILTLIPLPETLRPFRPHWITLALFYLGVFLPLQSGMVRSWLLGIVVDALTGTLFGVHALTFAFTTFIALQLHLQLRVFVIPQQMVVITLLILVNLTIEAVIQGATTTGPQTLLFWGPLLTTPLFWPPFYLLAERLGRRR